MLSCCSCSILFPKNLIFIIFFIIIIPHLMYLSEEYFPSYHFSPSSIYTEHTDSINVIGLCLISYFSYFLLLQLATCTKPTLHYYSFSFFPFYSSTSLSHYMTVSCISSQFSPSNFFCPQIHN